MSMLTTVRTQWLVPPLLSLLTGLWANTAQAGGLLHRAGDAEYHRSHCASLLDLCALRGW
jgi:hypothetical protein